MRAWLAVMIVLVVAALALTVYGALSDRAKNRRRAEEMLGPPERDIPRLPADARAPTYVTEAQARRRPTPKPATATTETTTTATRVDVEDETTDSVEIPTGWASADFATDADRREAVLDDADVLVCEGPVEAVRELLPALEHALRTRIPLVVVAPAIAPDVLGTLEVNAIQAKARLLAVIAGAADAAAVVETTGASPVDATDRHSGWLDPDALGHVRRWTSTARQSRLVRGRT